MGKTLAVVFMCICFVIMVLHMFIRFFLCFFSLIYKNAHFKLWLQLREMPVQVRIINVLVAQYFLPLEITNQPDIIAIINLCKRKLLNREFSPKKYPEEEKQSRKFFIFFLFKKRWRKEKLFIIFLYLGKLFHSSLVFVLELFWKLLKESTQADKQMFFVFAAVENICCRNKVKWQKKMLSVLHNLISIIDFCFVLQISIFSHK